MPVVSFSNLNYAAQMPRVHFTPNLKQHVDCPPQDVSGMTVREALEAALTQNGQLRGYILDDLDRLRQHMVIFVDGNPIVDRNRLSDRVSETSEIYVMQALSGG